MKLKLELLYSRDTSCLVLASTPRKTFHILKIDFLKEKANLKLIKLKPLELIEYRYSSILLGENKGNRST